MLSSKFYTKTNIFIMKQLKLAISTGNVESIKNLVMSGKIDVNCKLKINEENSKSFKYTNLLHLALSASSNNNTELIDVLLNAGADVNLKCNDDFPITPLQAVIKNGQDYFVSLLLKKGADPNIKDKNDANAIDYVMKADSLFFDNHKKVSLINLLLKHGAVTSPTFKDSVENILEIPDEQLLNSLYDLGLLTDKEHVNTALKNKNVEIIKFFLKKNLINIDHRSWNDSLLMKVVLLENDNVAEFLLKFDYFETCKRTVWFAMTYRMFKTVRTLLLNDIKINGEQFSTLIYQLALSMLFKELNGQISSPDISYYDMLFELVKHAAKMISMSQPFDVESLKKIIEGNDVLCPKEYKKMLERCNEELKKLKCHYIYKELTLYDLLIKKNIRTFVKNKVIVEAISKEFSCVNTNLTFNSDAKYPIYGNLILKRFLDEVEKLEFQNKVRSTLAYLIGLDFDATHVVLDEIMSYLSPKELLTLSYV